MPDQKIIVDTDASIVLAPIDQTKPWAQGNMLLCTQRIANGLKRYTVADMETMLSTGTAPVDFTLGEITVIVKRVKKEWEAVGHE